MIKLDERTVSKTTSVLLFRRETSGNRPSVEISWLSDTRDPGSRNGSGVDAESLQYLSVASCGWEPLYLFLKIRPLWG